MGAVLFVREEETAAFIWSKKPIKISIQNVFKKKLSSVFEKSRFHLKKIAWVREKIWIDSETFTWKARLLLNKNFLFTKTFSPFLFNHNMTRTAFKNHVKTQLKKCNDKSKKHKVVYSITHSSFTPSLTFCLTVLQLAF